MLRHLKMAALVLAVAMASSGVARAQEGRSYYDRDESGYGHPRIRVGWDMGYQDGSRVARQDLTHRKPYDPYPRGKYSPEDHGYRGEYGDRDAYRNQYARGYQQGYVRSFGRY
jgi:hypothetical protein